MKKRMALLLVLLLLVAVLLSVVLVPASRGRTEPQADDTVMKMENLPGPIDDVIFVQTGENAYVVTITLDNGIDYFTFDLNVDESQEDIVPPGPVTGT